MTIVFLCLSCVQHVQYIKDFQYVRDVQDFQYTQNVVDVQDFRNRPSKVKNTSGIPFLPLSWFVFQLGFGNSESVYSVEYQAPDVLQLLWANLHTFRPPETYANALQKLHRLVV